MLIKKDHILGYKQVLTHMKRQKPHIVYCLNTVELHSKSITVIHLFKASNIWKLNSILLQNLCNRFYKRKTGRRKEEIIEKIRTYFKLNDNENATYQICGL